MSKTVNILYLSYDGMTDPLGRSQVLPYLTGLTKQGYRFHLISFEKSERFTLHRSEIEQYCSKNNIKWYPQSYTKKPALISTIFDLWVMYRKAKKVMSNHPIQLVHCRSYPSGIVGLHLQEKHSVKLLFDIRGFWPDERVEGKIWNLKNPLFRLVYRYFKNKEKQLFLEADGVVTLTKKSATYITENFDSKESFQVIPCAADLKLFTPRPDEIRVQYRQELGLLEGDFALLYLGSVGTWYLLEEMMVFFIELKKVKPSSKFVFYTADSSEDILNKAIQKNISPTDIIIRSVNRAEMPAYLSAVDASIFFILPSFSKMASSPTKHGELLAMKIPCVYNNVGDLDEISQGGKTGVLVQEFTPIAYRQTVESLLNQNFYDFEILAESYYSLEKGISKYNKIYERLLI